jgi:hypothetical protein
MPLATQIHILKLSASCETVRTVSVFRDHKWSSPDKGIFGFESLISISICCVYFPFIFFGPAAVVQGLNEHSANGGWALYRVVKTSLYSSREKKTAWIFKR